VDVWTVLADQAVLARKESVTRVVLRDAVQSKYGRMTEADVIEAFSNMACVFS